MTTKAWAAGKSADLDDEPVMGDLLARVLAREERAWGELLRNCGPRLRAVAVAALEGADRAAVDDVLGDFWLRVVDDDFRLLRRFDAAGVAPLLSWLAFHLSQVAFEHAQRAVRETRMVPLAEIGDVADLRPPPRIEPRRAMLRVEEVAERWDLNLKTVYGMIERGELAARRCGRVLRVPMHVVQSFEQASVAPGRK